MAADLSLRTLLRAPAFGIGFGFLAQSATSRLDRGKRWNFRASVISLPSNSRFEVDFRAEVCYHKSRKAAK